MQFLYQKNTLAPLGITVAASAINAGIQKQTKKRKHGSGTTTLKISDEEMNDIMKIVQAFEGFNILLKGVTKTIKNETKRRIFKHFIRYSRRKFVRKFIIRKGNVRAGFRNKKGKGIVRAIYGNKMNF